jgi:hypothetical protein
MNISKLMTEMDENVDGDKAWFVPKKLSEAGGRGGTRATYNRNQTETRWNLTAEPCFFVG